MSEVLVSQVGKKCNYGPTTYHNKKILLHERKRHTDRRVVSPVVGVDRQMDGWMDRHV